MSAERESTPIAVDSRRPRGDAAWFSLLGAGIVALTILALWWIVRSSGAQQVAAQRRLSDVTVTWECPEGHTFEGRGGHVRLPCRACNRTADMQTTYACPNHGEMSALIRVEREPDGNDRLAQVSFRKGLWTEIRSAVVCPECGARISPATNRPLTKPADD